MKICVIGNCQIAPLRPLLAALSENLHCDNLPSVYSMTPHHEQAVAEAIANADWVIGQLVTDEYHVPFVRTSVLRKQLGSRLIVWPNAYFSGYAPEYFTLYDPEFEHFAGPLLGYHSEKIILGFFTGLTPAQTAATLSTASSLDKSWYANAVSQSFASLKSRETRTDIIISDFIEAHFTTRRLFHIMNHPSIEVLQELALRILRRIGAHCAAGVPSRLFMDLEPLEAFYPENPFIREQHKLAFPESCPESRHYRGVSLTIANTTLGVRPNGARIYSEPQMIEAMFTFYNLHKSRLAGNDGIKAILDRPRP